MRPSPLLLQMRDEAVTFVFHSARATGAAARNSLWHAVVSLFDANTYMLRFFIGTVIVLAIALLLLRLFERRLVFFPSRHPAGFWQPERFGVRVEEVWLNSDTNKIHGWFVRHEAAAAALVMAHGNAGNLSDRIGWLALLQQHVPAHLLMFDYRGYGRSEGVPSEEGCYRDAEAAYDWLRQRHPDLPIFAHGHSLGGAVVIELAGRRALHGLIVESSFTHARDMAGLMFGPLPVYWLSTMKWQNLEKVAALKIPKLFIHGERDRVIPHAFGQALYQHAAEPKQFLTLAEADHNDTYIAGGEKYFHALRSFILANVNNKPRTSNSN